MKLPRTFLAAAAALDRDPETPRDSGPIDSSAEPGTVNPDEVWAALSTVISTWPRRRAEVARVHGTFVAPAASRMPPPVTQSPTSLSSGWWAWPPRNRHSSTPAKVIRCSTAAE